MIFKAGDKVTWIKDKNVSGKIVSINDFRPPELECAVDFGFNDVVFCSREELILDESVTKQESVICKLCEQEIEEGSYLLKVREDLFCENCYEDQPIVFYYRLNGDDGWMDDSEAKEYRLEDYLEEAEEKA
ncbi:TPA_asm: hypothetical protein GHE07_07705 [Listeria monocytogenes]|uniref:hypothetical protein n=1 Tax=Listeria monocytogenes TaxID=1639 RepID=UPI000BE0E1BB|nr:hypothetical protein [Listeria monocytogenes]EAC3226097.1 hypothetical protein [Listeria monocytogenes]EAC7326837.1 hypothetical protein [Listeria monocytogenes]EAC8652058.1 hypothetical protein [Listeria monocytogenes]EAD6879798.1 hypothetical protein [Listeria monocytogenes]EAE0153269.1 hypothetical protein [Listeria monocytogenes]